MIDGRLKKPEHARSRRFAGMVAGDLLREIIFCSSTSFSKYAMDTVL